MAVDHYENFPVASVLLPRRLRRPVADIYRFARSADDIADEGDAEPDYRLKRLADYRLALDQIRGGRLALTAQDLKQIFEPLAQTVAQFNLPLKPFHDLLSAFEQDVRVSRYMNDATLLSYCRLSANPVGLLMLHLYDRVSAENLAWSDAICTGLQLVNFWQDVAVDWEKNRVYLPQEKLQRHGVSERYIAAQTESSRQRPGLERGESGSPATRIQEQVLLTTETQAWQALMREQVQQARELLSSGLPLTGRLPGRMGFELKLVVLGGLRILERLDELHYDIFFQRPVLHKSDWVLLLFRALRIYESERR